MKLQIVSRAALCFALSAGATGALSDVSPAEAWDEFRSQLSADTSTTLEVGSETKNGDILEIRDIRLISESRGATGTVTIPGLDFIDNGDGTVSMPFSDVISVTSTYEVEGEDHTFSGDIVINGSETLLSGTKDDMSIESTAAKVGVVFEDMVPGDSEVKLNVQLSLNGMSSVQRVVNTNGLRHQGFDMNANTADISFLIDEGDDNVDINAQFSDFEIKGSATTPEKYNSEKISAAIKSGLSFDAQLTTSQGAMIVATDADGTEFQATVATGPTQSDFALGKAGLNVLSDIKNINADFTSADLPFPVNITAASVQEGITIPMLASDSPQDIGFRLGLNEISVNEEVWSMIDFSGQLPHDPITLVLNFSGLATLTTEIDDLEDLENDEAPGTIEAANIEEFVLDAVGARVTGNGAFTFDNDDMVTFDGFPLPEGSIRLRGEGLNGLLDTLAAMGLVPNDQVMGARMMMGLFARSEGGDVLVSEVEVNAEGHVLVNGQRVQ